MKQTAHTAGEGPHSKLTAEELGKWMSIANQNALERERFADLCRELIAALQDIAEPMVKIQADAKAEGCTVNGAMANELCRDANWLRDKARAAIHKAEGQ